MTSHQPTPWTSVAWYMAGLIAFLAFAAWLFVMFAPMTDVEL